MGIKFVYLAVDTLHPFQGAIRSLEPKTAKTEKPGYVKQVMEEARETGLLSLEINPRYG